MAIWRFVDFCVPEAQHLADLTGVVADLRAVESLCDRLLSIGLPDTVEKSELAEALCAAALVKYGRTIASGVRAGLTEEHCSRLSAEHAEWHQYFKNLRDKWVAHSVNTFEENTVVAYLVPPERGPKHVSSISVHSRRVSTLSESAIVTLKDVAVALRTIVSAEVEDENQRVLTYARGLATGPLYESDSRAVELPSSSEAGKRRSKFGDA